MKARPSKLDAFADRLDEWFAAGQTLKQAQDTLAADGLHVSLGRLSKWWSERQGRRQQEQLLNQIASGARLCRDMETRFARDPAPELDTILRLHRVLILKLSTQGQDSPELLELVRRMMGPVMEHAKLVEKRRELELAETKYRDLVAERKAAIERELASAVTTGGITTETQQKIERELRLL